MSKTLKVILVLIIVMAIAVPTGVGIVNANKIPSFEIVSVVPDEVVTIETSDFPEDMKFDVLIGRYGNFGMDGTKVATQDSGKGGAFTATYTIPADLKGVEKLSIRLENKETGYYSYNWFENAVMPAKDETATAIPAAIPATAEEVIYQPSFTITSVEMDKNISVTGSGFPVDLEYDVLMGVYGSSGVGGVKVATQNSGPKGEFKATYTIPADFQGAYKIVICLESTKSDYYAYNYFFNASYPLPDAPSVVEATKVEPPVATVASLGYEGYPSFTVTSVKKDASVAIQAENLPADDTFDVYMTDYMDGSAKIVKAGTLETKNGGSAVATFSIPAEMKGVTQISVRLSGLKSGFFAYNFFFNSDFPAPESTQAAVPTEAPAPTPAPTATP